MSEIVQQTSQAPSVIGDMATRFGMDRRAFESTLKATIMPSGASDEQVAAFLLVAKKYELNPFTKEIFAFPGNGGIQPIVSVDGWLKIINDHPQFDGLEFSDKINDKGELLAVTCRIYRKDRSRPVEVTEYMGECRRQTPTWKQWPARMLRHKSAIQAARYAFGFSGIMEPDEADRIEAAQPTKTDALMPRAKVIAQPVPMPHSETLEDAQREQEVARVVTKEAPNKVLDGGIHGLSESMERLLIEAAKRAGVTRDQLIDRYVRIDTSNFNDIRADLKSMVEDV